MWRIMRYAIPLVVAAKIGGCVAVMEYNSVDVKEPHAQILTDRQAVVTDPQYNTKYIIDFENKTMMEYDKNSAEHILKDDNLEDMVRR